MTVQPSGTVARVSTVYQDCGKIGDIPVVRVTYGKVEGLPPAPARKDDLLADYDEACAGTADVPVYLVSGLVLENCRGRADVFAPDTGAGAVRDDAGRIIGTTRLIAVGREII